MNLKAVCFNDEKSLEPFVMGVIYSTCSQLLNSSYTQGVPVMTSDVKEMILMIRDWVETK